MMDPLSMYKFIANIGDGVILFFLIFSFCGEKSTFKMVFSGILSGTLFYIINGLTTASLSFVSVISTIMLYFIAVVLVIRIMRVNIRFHDYLFMFAVTFFAHMVNVSILVTIGSILGISIIDTDQTSIPYGTLINLFSYACVYASGVFVIHKRDSIELVLATNRKVFTGIAMGSLAFSTLNYLLIASFDLASTGNMWRYRVKSLYIHARPPVVFMLAVCLLIFVFFVMSRYIMRNEVLQAKIRHQESLNARLHETVETVRPIKHAFRNRLSVIQALINANATDALADYVRQLTEEAVLPKEPAFLEASKITHVGLAALTASMLREIQEQDVPVDFTVNFQTDTIEIRLSDLCDILSVFFVNALEASKEMGDSAHICIQYHNDSECFLATVANVYTQPIDLDRIFQKNYSSKGAGRGLGLWHAQQLIQKYDNVYHDCCIKNNHFCHTLVVSNTLG